MVDWMTLESLWKNQENSFKSAVSPKVDHESLWKLQQATSASHSSPYVRSLQKNHRQSTQTTLNSFLARATQCMLVWSKRTNLRVWFHNSSPTTRLEESVGARQESEIKDALTAKPSRAIRSIDFSDHLDKRRNRWVDDLPWLKDTFLRQDFVNRFEIPTVLRWNLDTVFYTELSKTYMGRGESRLSDL